MTEDKGSSDANPFSSECYIILISSIFSIIPSIVLDQLSILSLRGWCIGGRVIIEDQSFAIAVVLEDAVDVVADQYGKDEVDFLYDEIGALGDVFVPEEEVVLYAAWGGDY